MLKIVTQMWDDSKDSASVNFESETEIVYDGGLTKLEPYSNFKQPMLKKQEIL